MGVKEWSERLKGMIRTPQRDYPNDPKVTPLTALPNFFKFFNF